MAQARRGARARSRPPRLPVVPIGVRPPVAVAADSRRRRAQDRVPRRSLGVDPVRKKPAYRHPHLATPHDPRGALRRRSRRAFALDASRRDRAGGWPLRERDGHSHRRRVRDVAAHPHRLRRRRLRGALERRRPHVRGRHAARHAADLQRLPVELDRDHALLADCRPRGSAAGLFNRWHDLRTIAAAAAFLDRVPAPKPAPLILPTGRTSAELRGLAPALPQPRRVGGDRSVELWSAPFLPRGAKAGGKPFTRIEGADLGFERLPLPRPYQLMEPGPMHLGGLAAGDVNGDGWPDVVVGTHFGVQLYANVGGRFALQQIDFPPMKEWIVSVVARVDLDGDRALDLFFCTWMHGCHILYNRGGSLAFADVDRKGRLDIVTGASTSQPRFFYPAPAVNRLWHNRGEGRFDPEALAGPEGDTLTLLFTDLNGDGWPDLFVGNDFDEPDRIYLNDRGTLRPIKAAQSPIPRSTTTTMSADTADLDNDGRDELYIAQIAMGTVSQMAKALAAPVGSCDVYPDIAERSRCDASARFQLASIDARNHNDIEPCLQLADPLQQRDCVVTAHHWFNVLVRLPALGGDKAKVLEQCEKIPADFTTLHDVCGTIARSEMDHEQSDVIYADELPSVKHTNLLYAPSGNGFRDVTGEWHAEFGGWSWNARFADLDNDTWQDLYVVQGSRLRPGSASATFYRNQQGKTFKDETKAFGLEDHVPTGSSVYVDLNV
ncbi:MAG: VCBS repeat-containing protein, partial [Deltaproteobacteria bacterium]